MEENPFEFEFPEEDDEEALTNVAIFGSDLGENPFEAEFREEEDDEEALTNVAIFGSDFGENPIEAGFRDHFFPPDRSPMDDIDPDVVPISPSRRDSSSSGDSARRRRRHRRRSRSDSGSRHDAPTMDVGPFLSLPVFHSYINLQPRGELLKLRCS